MANDYFNHVANVIDEGIRALAAQVNNIATEIATGLDKLPTEIQLKRGTTRYAVDTGAADAYVVTLPYTPALQDGLEVSFRAINANTGASTLNVNGLGAKALVYFDLTALTANAIVAGSMITARYSSANDHFVMISQSGKVVAIGDAATLDGLDSTQFLRSDAADVMQADPGATADLLQVSKIGTGTGDALDVRIGTGGRGLAVYDGNNIRTQTLVDFIVDNPSSSGTALRIQQDGTGSALNIQHTSTGANLVTALISQAGDNYAAQITNTSSGVNAGGISMTVNGGANSQSLSIQGTSTGAGLLIDQAQTTAEVATIRGNSKTGGSTVAVTANNATYASGQVLNVVQDHASAGAVALRVQQDGNAIALDVAASQASVALNIAQSGGAGAIFVGHTGSAGIAVDVDVQTGTAVRAARFYSNVASRTVPVVDIVNDNATGNGVALNIQQDQAGNGITILKGGSGGSGIDSESTNGLAAAGRFYANTASRIAPVVQIVNDNATGSGRALSIQQDQDGHSIYIDHNAVTAGQHAIRVDTDVQSGGLYIGSLGNGGTEPLVDIQQDSTTTAITALRVDTAANGRVAVFSTNVASRTVPVVEIINDNATGSGIGLKIQQDQAGDGMEIDATNAGARAAEFVSAVASRTVPLVEIRTISPTGTGAALDINQIQSGPALNFSNKPWIGVLNTVVSKFRSGGIVCQGEDGTGDFYGLVPEFRFNSASESRTSTTTLSDTNDLSVELASSGYYEFEICLVFGCAISGVDAKWNINTTGMSTNMYGVGQQTNGATVGALFIYNESGAGLLDSGDNVQDIVGTDNAMVKISGYCLSFSPGGTLTVQFAQNVSNASPVDLEIGSYIKFNRISNIF